MKLECPFVYASGKQCIGRIVRVEVYKADITWEQTPGGQWDVSWNPRSHYHLFCSEKGNHAGHKMPDDERMKFYFHELPKAVRSMLESAPSHGDLSSDADA